VKFKALTAVLMKIQVVADRRPADFDRLSEELNASLFRVHAVDVPFLGLEDGRSELLRNVGNCNSVYGVIF
jgi:hypothetical protein